MDPFTEIATLSILCDIEDPLTRQPYSGTRAIPPKSGTVSKESGIADVAYFGAEAEFYLFNEIRYDYKPNSSFHFIDSMRQPGTRPGRGAESRL
jgi:glutamine synthetase